MVTTICGRTAPLASGRTGSVKVSVSGIRHLGGRLTCSTQPRCKHVIPARREEPTMADCIHLDREIDAPPSGTGCVECLAMGGRWVHLRRCAECGHIGCCDSSPN